MIRTYTLLFGIFISVPSLASSSDFSTKGAGTIGATGTLFLALSSHDIALWHVSSTMGYFIVDNVEVATGLTLLADIGDGSAATIGVSSGINIYLPLPIGSPYLSAGLHTELAYSLFHPATAMSLTVPITIAFPVSSSAVFNVGTTLTAVFGLNEDATVPLDKGVANVQLPLFTIGVKRCF